MLDENSSRKQLMEELLNLRERVIALETSEQKQKQITHIDQAATFLIQRFRMQGKTMTQLWEIIVTNYEYKDLTEEFALLLECRKERVDGTVLRKATA